MMKLVKARPQPVKRRNDEAGPTQRDRGFILLAAPAFKFRKAVPLSPAAPTPARSMGMCDEAKWL